MKKSRISPISKKKCKQNMIEVSSHSHSFDSCGFDCKNCEKPRLLHVVLRKPINPISKKKRKEISEEKPMREALWERCQGRCENCGRLAEQCLGGIHPHEWVKRSKGGHVSMESSMLCNTCHGNLGHNLRIVEH